MIVHLIVAIGKRGQIGLNGHMPWGMSMKEDLRWFKRMTSGGFLVVGYKTAPTLPQDLGNRRRLVWHRGMDPKEVLSYARDVDPFRDMFIVGGAATYKAFMPYVAVQY